MADATLRDALATALHQYRDPDCHAPNCPAHASFSLDAADILAHPAVATWLRRNDEALVALADTTQMDREWGCVDCTKPGGKHMPECVVVVYADDIAAACERLEQ